MNAKIRIAVSVIAGAALSAMLPLTALAEPPVNSTTIPIPTPIPTPSIPVSVNVGGSASTTGTTAGATVPGTASTGGGPITVTSPDTGGVSTGSGPATVTGSAPISGPGITQGDTSVSTGPTGGSSTAAGSTGAGAALGTMPGVSAKDPVSRSSVRAGAQAHTVLCLLAQWSAQPSKAVLSSLCDGRDSNADSGARVGAGNEITGTTLDSDATVRAAVCLLGLVTSPSPSHVKPGDVSDASASTLCGGTPSTTSASGDSTVTSSRTGTQVSAAPIVSAAACLLANGVVATTTTVDLATTCASMTGNGGPSSVDGSAPIITRDSTTGTPVDLAPAASAATCVLLNALARIPDNAADSSATASLNTSCASASGTTPSGGNAVVPTSGGGSPSGSGSPSGGGSPASIDLAPAANAALCILANADLAASGSGAALSDACGTGTTGGTTPGGNPGGTGGNPGGTTPGNPGGNPSGTGGNVADNGGPGDSGTSATSGGGTTVGGTTPAGGGTTVGGTTPAGSGTTTVTVTTPPSGPGGTGVQGVQTGGAAPGTGSVTSPASGNGPATINGVEIASLPSTSTAVAGGGALLAILAATLLAMRRKRD